MVSRIKGTTDTAVAIISVMPQARLGAAAAMVVAMAVAAVTVMAMVIWGC